VPQLPHRRLALLVLALGATLAACEDSPTASATYAHVADGRTWVAVAEPAGLPTMDTWLPFVGVEAAADLRTLRGEAARARGAGRIEEARALEAEGFARAARALHRTPDERDVLVALAALESWVSRAEARLLVDDDADLAATVGDVRALHREARTALAAGERTAAVVHVTGAAAAAREWSPVAVGLRLLARAEHRLETGEVPEEAARRARRLLVGAREGLATGDTVRAVRRALYALQVLDAGAAIDPREPRR
jgi:hypothetical protein